MEEVGRLKAQLVSALASVEGWTFFDEVWALHEAARQLAGRGRRVTVVEIGSWKGRSTIGLALGLKAGGVGTVYAIDPHTGSSEFLQMHGPVDTYGAFVKNVELAGVNDLVRPIRAKSHEARDQFDERTIDLLFVDGSHEYADVKQDIQDWTPAISDEAVVAFNDPFRPGVYRALRELVLQHSSPYRRTTQVHNTLFFQFRRTAPWQGADDVALIRVRSVMALHFLAGHVTSYLPRWLVLSGRRVYERLLGVGSSLPPTRSSDGR
jgi:predicted O-methyltransferase YrrM